MASGSCRASRSSVEDGAPWGEEVGRRWSGRAPRRLDRLLALGALAFDVEIAPEHLGYDVEALLWVTVVPGLLDDTAHAVAGHALVAFAAATSGTANLVLATGFHDVPDLYAYLAREPGRHRQKSPEVFLALPASMWMPWTGRERSDLGERFEHAVGPRACMT